LPPPDGQRFVQGQLRLEHAERLQAHRIVAYPVVDMYREAHARVFGEGPIALTRYGARPAVYVVPSAMVKEDGTLNIEGAPDASDLRAFDAWLVAQPGVTKPALDLGGVMVAPSGTTFTTYVDRVEVVRASTESVELRVLPVVNERGEEVTRPSADQFAVEGVDEDDGCAASPGRSPFGAVVLLLGWVLCARRRR